ncbi:hypothetical protein K439DRAFT_1637239 [Ramaria rubella]|nr:hypothetical protein K439DRAFT_1637239 [Ramaria rubella]
MTLKDKPHTRQAPRANDYGGIQIGPSKSRPSERPDNWEPRHDSPRQDKLHSNSMQPPVRPQPIRWPSQFGAAPAPNPHLEMKAVQRKANLRHLRQETKQDVNLETTEQQVQPVGSFQPRGPIPQTPPLQVEGDGAEPPAYPEGARKQDTRLNRSEDRNNSNQREKRNQTRGRPSVQDLEKGDEYKVETDLKKKDAVEHGGVRESGNRPSEETVELAIAPPAPRLLRQPQTILDNRIHIDASTYRLEERQGGDYRRFFSGEDWKLARLQTAAPLGVVDYAKLALHLNGSASINKRREGLEVIKKYVSKAEIAAS